MASGDVLIPGYVSVKLASEVILPKSGADKSLNPIIYHHAITGCKELWHEVPQIIADKTKRLSYTFDMRCHGESDWSDAFNSEILIEDLLQFMKSKNVNKAVLVGHSIGGLIISKFALKYPEKVEMIINEDGALDAGKMTALPVLNYIKLWEEGVKAASKDLSETEAIKFAFDYVYERMSAKEGLEDKEVMCKFQYPIKPTDDGYVVKHDMKTICKYLEDSSKDKLEIAGVYEGPALFMMARGSDFHKEMNIADIRKLFPNVELQIVEGVKHNIHLAYVDKFLAAFMTFYEKHRPQ